MCEKCFFTTLKTKNTILLIVHITIVQDTNYLYSQEYKTIQHLEEMFWVLNVEDV
jgi:hypothetical protein